MAKKKEEKIDFKAGAESAKEHAVMPQAPGVEKSLLSMMSIDPTNIISQCIADGLNEEYFYIPAHRILWEIFRNRYEKGIAIDAVSVAQELADNGKLESVGGNAGLMDIFSFSTTTALYNTHFETLKEKYIRRSIILTANRATDAAYTSEAEIEQLLDQTEQEVLQIRHASAKGEEWSLKVDIEKAVSNLERMM
ncbi:MAG: hypothetical protein IJ993_05375, partial [Akkermansia sp.]|nr:hypothetical protein [Akkermansia sp.]